MRYYSKPSKCKRSYESIIHKKCHKSRRMWGSLANFLSPAGVDLDKISEAIRINRYKRTAGKGGWKVLPKDSWDLYNKYKKRGQLEKKDIKTKNKKKTEKIKSDSKRRRPKTLKKPKKLNNKKRGYGGQATITRNSLIKTNTQRRINKKSYRQSKKKVR